MFQSSQSRARFVWSHRKSTVNFVLNNKHKRLDKFYLCGPEEMINIVSGVLKNTTSRNQILNELFATSTKENAIEKSLGGIQNHHHGR
jgi:ring-1,2-phenylacetyl-CoA epoxidase subunit PaaE